MHRYLHRSDDSFPSSRSRRAIYISCVISDVHREHKERGPLFPAQQTWHLWLPFCCRRLQRFFLHDVRHGFDRILDKYKIISGKLSIALCGYCGCVSPTYAACPLLPPISIGRNRDQLCNGNRMGKLCGGCRFNFSQSLDDRSCIGNKKCWKRLWWVWMLLIFGLAAYRFLYRGFV